MRILHVIPGLDPRTGGTAKVVIDLSRAQVQAGLKVSILSTFSAGDQSAAAVESLRRQGVAVELLGPTTGKFQSHPQMQVVVRQQVAQADVAHIHAIWEDLQHHTAVEARRAGVPYVWMPHGMLDPWSLSQSKWQKKLVLAWRVRRCLQRAAAMVFTNDVERDLVAPLKLAPSAIVEPLGLDWSEFADLPAPGSFRSKYPQIAGRRIVLFLSRVHPKKGLDLLFPAFAAAAGEGDVLVIAGPVAEGYQPALDETISRHQLQERTLFTGMLYGRDRLAAMVDATLFVLPSYQENFGIAVAEAIGAGCPTIISDQVNIWKELNAARAAGIVPARLDELTQMLKAWLLDESLRTEYAQRGRAFVRDRYDWHKIASRWVDHYQRIAPGRGKA